MEIIDSELGYFKIFMYLCTRNIKIIIIESKTN